MYWGDTSHYALDFHQFYAVGQLPAHQVYDLEAQHAAEMELWKEHRSTLMEFNFSPFLKPAYYWLALMPLAKQPFWTAYWVFVAFQGLSFLLAVYLLHRRFNLELYVLFLLPMCPYVGVPLTWGQDIFFVFLCVVLALELALRDRQGLGGAVLALGLIKWNLLLLFPVVMLVQRRTKLFTGFAIVALLEIGLSIWIPGRNGLLQYLSNYGDPSAHYWDTLMPSFYGLLLDIGISNGVAAGLTLAASAVFVYYARNLQLTQTFAVLGVAGPLLAMHSMGYDLLFALVPIVICGAYFQTPFRGMAAVLFLSPLPYLASTTLDIMAPRAMLFVVSAIVMWGLFRPQDAAEPAANLQLQKHSRP